MKKEKKIRKCRAGDPNIKGEFKKEILSYRENLVSLLIQLNPKGEKFRIYSEVKAEIDKLIDICEKRRCY